jgi:predicted kinase
MTKVVMMKGLPASGKSTKSMEWLAHGNFVRLNRDDLRESLFKGLDWSGKREKVVMRVQTAMAHEAIEAGYSIVVDDTNLTDFHRKRWGNVADVWGASFVVDEMKTDVDECIKRDRQRHIKRVGDHVIYQMALENDMLPFRDIIICDIDGTIADLTHRLHYVKGDTKDWTSFFQDVVFDDFREGVWDQVCSEGVWRKDCEIIFVSGRSDITRSDTEMWLKEKTGLKNFILLMRQSWDRRDDTVVKREMYDKYLSRMRVVRVYDDRPRVIRMWRDLGLDVVDVGTGEEF